MKRVKVVIFTIFSILIAGCITFVIISAIAKDRYWKAPRLAELTVNISKYENFLNEIHTESSDIEEVVLECNMKAVNVSKEVLAFTGDCNKIIIKYFNEAYEVDISSRLSALQVMSAEYPEEISENVGGSFYKEVPGLSDKLFINSTILNAFTADISKGKSPSVYDNETFSFKMLRTIYIHEAIHYLGFSEIPLLDSFDEAITEYLAEMAVKHSGIKYENITGYSEIKKLAEQLIESDPEIVSGVLSDESFNLGEYFNSNLGGDWAGTYDQLVLMLQHGGAKTYKEIPYLIQFITNEYVKSAGNNTDYSNKSSIVNGFELKWFIGLWNKESIISIQKSSFRSFGNGAKAQSGTSNPPWLQY